MNNIIFSVNDSKMLGWLTLTSGGVDVELTVNLDVRTLVTRELKIPDDYLENRIQTVFLDGSPVDDIDEAIVRPDQDLTLCTALPGAMGICMRRDSPLKAYRAGIGHCEDCDQLVDPKPGRITLKYFNFIAREQGGSLLQRGVILKPAPLKRFLESRDADFWDDIASIEVNGVEKEIEDTAVFIMNRKAEEEITVTVRPVE